MTLLLDLDFIMAEAGEGRLGRHHTSPSTVVHLQFSIIESRRKRYKDKEKTINTWTSGLCDTQQ